MTPTAYSGCNRSAPVGNKQSDNIENGGDDNYLESGRLGNKSDELSLAVIDKNTSPSQVSKTLGKGFNIL